MGLRAKVAPLRMLPFYPRSGTRSMPASRRSSSGCSVATLPSSSPPADRAHEPSPNEEPAPAWTALHAVRPISGIQGVQWAMYAPSPGISPGHTRPPHFAGGFQLLLQGHNHCGRGEGRSLGSSRSSNAATNCGSPGVPVCAQLLSGLLTNIFLRALTATHIGDGRARPPTCVPGGGHGGSKCPKPLTS